ncbi:MAG: YerC/YecD family TrpR-related protein [Candidatus Gracilibacteria bacterium]|nr:YerC/YecD family TrpR-related protein [Candidatus Gracilibacteria bacterium]MDQ7021991.1 YerC/YecD family TrpR-related protein [Candidatus Gracilibacteria bacterium]
MKRNELEFEMEDILNFLILENSKERVLDFLMDSLSEKELLKIALKFNVAKMLEQGISYSRIEKKTGMSSATIAKTSKSLNGDNLGYKNAINTLSGNY